MKSLSTGRKSMGQPWAMNLFGVVFSGVGVLVFFWLSGLPLIRWMGAMEWTETPCVIVKSEVGSHSDSDGTTYSVDIVYTYTHDGRDYRGDRYIFQGGSSSGYDRKAAVVAEYPEGSERVCYVNPDEPGESVLSVDFNLAYLLGLFGMPFMLFGLAVVLISRWQQSGTSISGRGTKHEDIGVENTYRSGDLALEGTSNSRVGCVFIFVFTAIWNGITVTAFFSMVFGDGNEGWFPILFLVPFLLVGVGTMVLFVYFFLSMFNPRPELVLSPGYLALGGTAELQWSFRGNPSRISKLTLTLVGEQKASYRRGTSTVTDESTFQKQVLVETEVTREMLSGRVQIAIPEFSAPTFSASNNKIVWSIKVHGDIKRWPDVNEEFEIPVSPLPSQTDHATPSLAEFHPR